MVVRRKEGRDCSIKTVLHQQSSNPLRLASHMTPSSPLPPPLRIGKGGTTDATIAASDSEGTATELVLMQVASFLKHEVRTTQCLRDRRRIKNVTVLSQPTLRGSSERPSAASVLVVVQISTTRRMNPPDQRRRFAFAPRNVRTSSWQKYALQRIF